MEKEAGPPRDRIAYRQQRRAFGEQAVPRRELFGEDGVQQPLERLVRSHIHAVDDETLMSREADADAEGVFSDIFMPAAVLIDEAVQHGRQVSLRRPPVAARIDESELDQGEQAVVVGLVAWIEGKTDQDVQKAVAVESPDDREDRPRGLDCEHLAAPTCSSDLNS